MVGFALRYLEANFDDVQSMFDEELEGKAGVPPISKEMLDKALSEIDDCGKYVVKLWENKTSPKRNSGYRGRRWYAYGDEGEVYSSMDDALHGAALACEEFGVEPKQINIYKLVEVGREEYQEALSKVMDEG